MIYEFDNKYPNIHESAFIAKSADIIGNVEICENANIWFGAVLRGDGEKITVGKNSNIQDNSVIHIEEDNLSVEIGENVTIGHGAIIHGCKIGDNALIGMRSIILNGAKIGNNTLIGAGSLVTEGKVIPSGVLCMGSPAKIIRELTEEEKRNLKISADNYVKLAKRYNQEEK